MLASQFLYLLLTVLFPFVATALMTGRTLERRSGRRTEAATWIAMLTVSCMVSLILTWMIVGIDGSAAGSGDAGAAVLICNLSMTVFCVISTCTAYGGTPSSRVSVALLYSSMCFTAFVGIDIVLGIAGLGFRGEWFLLCTVAHLLATAAVYVLVFGWVVTRIRRMIASTGGRMERFMPVLAMMFAVITVDYAMVMYGGRTDARGLCVDAMVVVSIILCLYLILTKLDSEIRVDAYRRELDAAWTIQQSCLPDEGTLSSVEGVGIHAHIAPAKEVGGDFYDVVPLTGGRTAVLVADVSGKGIPAAMFAMRAKTLVTERLRAGDGAAECLSSVNRSLMEGNSGDMFVTMLLCILDEDGDVTCSSAGHPSPLVRRNGEVSEADIARGRMLGVLPSGYGETVISLGGGDCMLLYTDGATDAEDASGRMFGLSGLESAFASSGGDPCSDIASAIGMFSDGAERSDDLTLVSVSL